MDIDNHHMDLPEDLPLFPDQSELIQELSEVLLRFGLPPQGGATTARLSPTPTAPCLSSLVLEDLMEDRRNGNLGGEELAVLERLQALARRCGGGKMTDGGKMLGRTFEEEEEELKTAKMNVQLREVFAGRFAAIFGRYEEFVIHSAPDLESWLSNREGTSNFDKVQMKTSITQVQMLDVTLTYSCIIWGCKCMCVDMLVCTCVYVSGLLPVGPTRIPSPLPLPVPGDCDVLVVRGR